MRIAYTPEQERLRRELRAYFGGLMTAEVRAGAQSREGATGDGDYGNGRSLPAGGPAARPRTAGWRSAGPHEHGGRGGTMLDQLIFTDEAAIARVPVPFLTINTVGPTIMRFGTPGAEVASTCRGSPPARSTSPIGYSEPEAWTDLASLRTTAVAGRGRLRDRRPEDVDEPDPVRRLRSARLPDRPGRADRHKGLSIIIVPTSAEGFSWTPVPTVAGVMTSATYYSSCGCPPPNWWVRRTGAGR